MVRAQHLVLCSSCVWFPIGDGVVLRQIVTDYDAILNDDSINCVVELMGGVTDAKDVSGFKGAFAGRVRLLGKCPHAQRTFVLLLMMVSPELSTNQTFLFTHSARCTVSLPVMEGP